MAGDRMAGDMPSDLAPLSSKKWHAGKEQEDNGHSLVGREETEKPQT